METGNRENFNGNLLDDSYLSAMKDVISKDGFQINQALCLVVAWDYESEATCISCEIQVG
jgi:hypothetical protein